jgi:hypothetical protein
MCIVTFFNNSWYCRKNQFTGRVIRAVNASVIRIGEIPRDIIVYPA